MGTQWAREIATIAKPNLIKRQSNMNIILTNPITNPVKIHDNLITSMEKLVRYNHEKPYIVHFEGNKNGLITANTIFNRIYARKTAILHNLHWEI